MTSHLHLFAAPSRAALVEAVREALAAARAGQAPPSRPVAGPHRLAVVAGTPDELAARLERAEGALAAGAPFAQAGAAFHAVSDGPPAPSAALFPGYGVRRTALARDLARAVPAVERWFDA
ncbi:MAG: hypothetical protein ACLGHP_09590, partial [Vicinamibacteria bacterium]